MTTSKVADSLILLEDVDEVDPENIEGDRYHEDRIGWQETARGVRA
jgi:hypothetical protein